MEFPNKKNIYTGYFLLPFLLNFSGLELLRYLIERKGGFSVQIGRASCRERV